MCGAAVLTQSQSACFVIADISGYTRFSRLRALSVLHAEEIITELLEAVISTAKYPLQIAKLEGDAVFLYAETGGEPAAAAQDVARQVTVFFEAFQARSRHLAATSICPCDACGHAIAKTWDACAYCGELTGRRIAPVAAPQPLGGETRHAPAPRPLVPTQAR